MSISEGSVLAAAAALDAIKQQNVKQAGGSTGRLLHKCQTTCLDTLKKNSKQELSKTK
jgi:hypothetical protein